jgi:hypothetical protein
LILASTSGMNYVEPLGPHAASYHNVLFKRALLVTLEPIIFFVDDSKFDQESYDPKRCFLVCGQDFKWEKKVANQPIAFCVGASSRDRAKVIVAALADIGLNLSSRPQPSDQYTDCVPFIAANGKFAVLFPQIKLAETDTAWSDARSIESNY